MHLKSEGGQSSDPVNLTQSSQTQSNLTQLNMTKPNLEHHLSQQLLPQKKIKILLIT